MQNFVRIKLFCLVVFCFIYLLMGNATTQARTIEDMEARAIQVKQLSQGNKVAIVIGINTYGRNSGLRPLRYAVSDADVLAKTLQKHGYVVETLMSRKATRLNVFQAIKKVGSALKDPKAGTLIVVFSGHGFAQNGSNYLASYDTDSQDMSLSALSMKELEQAIRATGIQRAVLFIDACRHNPGINIKQPSFISQKDEGVRIFYSTGFGDVGWESSKLKHGVFSYFLQLAFNGAASDSDGTISFDNLKNYVQKQVFDWTTLNLAYTQKPFSTGGDNGIFILTGSEKSRLQSGVSPNRKLFEPEMVNIPAGTFTMGCVPGRDDVNGGCHYDEKPAHDVTLGAFQIGKYEVTFDEWDDCERAGICRHADDKGWGRGKRPVINVSWNDAQTYVQWLTRQTGKHYRLPTEAEWEYAARGGTNTAYPWGNGINCSNADFWIGGPNGESCQGDGTSLVGGFARNGFGVNDTVGNVWEWTTDCYQNNYEGILPKGIAISSCGVGARRVIRGGSWSDGPEYVRSADRYTGSPSTPYYNVGLRVALDP